MSIKQYYNKRIGAWVKGNIVTTWGGGIFFKPLDVKQKQPKIPFKRVPKGNRMPK